MSTNEPGAISVILLLLRSLSVLKIEMGEGKENEFITKSIKKELTKMDNHTHRVVKDGSEMKTLTGTAVIALSCKYLEGKQRKCKVSAL